MRSKPRWWQPLVHAGRRPLLVKRAAITAATRQWFSEQDFIEVETAALQRSPGIEPHLHPFATDWRDIGGKPSQRFLHTSPEFAMKKLLVAGESRIFQLAKVWRNREDSPLHSPEFTMLEWYRAPRHGEGAIDWQVLIADCAALIALAARVAGCAEFRLRRLSCDPFAPIRQMTVAEAFEQFAGIDILATAPEPLVPDFGLLARAAERVGIAAHDGDDWESLYFRIMFDKIEPFLGQDAPLALTHYPLSMAALARPSRDDPRTAERVEVYCAGVELANGFAELGDAVEQRRRFELDQKRKYELYGEWVPIDEDLLAALEFGLPDCCGIALGFDRLVMLATGAELLEQVIWSLVE
ncbi:MAG: EF-P lysine aminoacylase EpmA [Candidatus Pacebacteria bacterium]|nr:EF-P lysine aminoacylase EpmA [Candidatus Paceibacterota bacterium]